MSSEISTIEESIKIALDAADAATDITSEYNGIKKQNQKLEAEVKKVYMYTTIIFGSSMIYYRIDGMDWSYPLAALLSIFCMLTILSPLSISGIFRSSMVE